MKKRRFKLKPVPTVPRHAAPPPAAESLPLPAPPVPDRAAAFSELPPPASIERGSEPAAPDLAAAFAEAIETLRRNLHCDRPAAQNQAAFLLYRIYAQEVRLPALENSLLAIESALDLKGRGRSLASRLKQIEVATARLRQSEEQRARSESLVPLSARQPSEPALSRCILADEELAEMAGDEVRATTGHSFAEGEEQAREQQEVGPQERGPSQMMDLGSACELTAEKRARKLGPLRLPPPATRPATAVARESAPIVGSADEPADAGGSRSETQTADHQSCKDRRSDLKPSVAGDARIRTPDTS